MLLGYTINLNAPFAFRAEWVCHHFWNWEIGLYHRGSSWFKIEHFINFPKILKTYWWRLLALLNVSIILFLGLWPFSSAQFSCSVVSDSLWPHELQNTRLPCPPPTSELTQTNVHHVSDAIQPSHPLHPLVLPPSLTIIDPFFFFKSHP